MKKFVKLIAVFVFVFILFAFYNFKTNYDFTGYMNNIINKVEGKTLDKGFKTKIKSGNLSTDYKVDEALSDIDKFGFNTLNVPVVINIKSTSSSDMSVDKESEKRAVDLIKKLRWKKINIILEPYPWIENGSKPETQWNPTNINEFFLNWKTKVLKVLIDDVAVPYHVDALDIGTSFSHMEYAEGYWSDTIDYVRKYYKGLVTYRTSWWITAHWKPELTSEYQKKLNNRMFSKLDFISIAAYFELTGNDTNTVSNLVNSINCTQIYDRRQNVKQEIKNFYTKWNKPIFFGELGFPKTDKASVSPWNPYLSGVKNDFEQANCFKAYEIQFENEPWNLGFSIFAVGEHGKDKKYYPGNDSTKIIKDWYSNKN